MRCDAEKVKHLPADLQEAPVEVLQQLSSGGANDVTHIFFTAFIGERRDETSRLSVTAVPTGFACGMHVPRWSRPSQCLVMTVCPCLKLRCVTSYMVLAETGDDVKNVEVNFGMLKTLIEVRR